VRASSALGIKPGFGEEDILSPKSFQASRVLKHGCDRSASPLLCEREAPRQHLSLTSSLSVLRRCVIPAKDSGRLIVLADFVKRKVETMSI
jgi:hypothetical protein